jgi:hypothetical protein
MYTNTHTQPSIYGLVSLVVPECDVGERPCGLILQVVILLVCQKLHNLWQRIGINHSLDRTRT